MVRWLALVLVLILAAYVRTEEQTDHTAQLIEALGADTFEERSKASTELKRRGKDITPQLVEAAKSHRNLEVRQQAQAIFAALEWGMALEKLSSVWKLTGDVREGEPVEITSALLKKFFPTYRFFEKRPTPFQPGMYSAIYAIQRFDPKPLLLKEMNSHMPPGSNFGKKDSIAAEIDSGCAQIAALAAVSGVKLAKDDDARDFIEAIQRLMWREYVINASRQATRLGNTWTVTPTLGGGECWELTVNSEGAISGLKWFAKKEAAK